ncbi:sensor histidine kinase [Altererythrobacter luteolus]|uniref:histidine kinase n=1 Tax=Pontixanthobacter luteolus TaxID=295089 RepID=A0A6I4V274_9SPHN|nr:HAMP domain-containing sensor histidine kinase [Pontixanthobacter luteolus]MXP47805.1 sensor histidine kinase [Pontixanthobacter luteolus]
MSSRPVPGSLRLRFLLAITLWVVLGIGAIWFSAVGIFSKHVEESYHEELEVHVRELGRLAEVGPDGQLRLTRPLSDPRYEEPLSGFYWQITARNRQALRSESMTRGTLDEHIAHSPEILHTLENGPSGPAITYGFTRKGPSDEDIHFVIATDQSELDRLIGSFTRDLSLWLVGLGVFLLATGMAIISFGLHPLDRLSVAIGRLRRGEAQDLEGRYPAEIAPLVADLNAYLHQNADMIAKSRVQAANLAHSLRTPLAVITDEAERLGETAGGREPSKVLLDQARAMEQQIDFQLARARSSTGQPYSARWVRLPEVAEPILRAMKRLHPDKHFVLETNNCDGVQLPLDEVDYSELLSILLDNAGKWATREVKLQFVCEPNQSFTARVIDDGSGMTEKELSHAFEIGSRFDRQKSGSGLGLAIARDLADALGLTLDLSNTPSGLAATVCFHPASIER